jgi:hypothetical protein
MGKFLFISLMICSMVVLSSTAYAQEMQWIKHAHEILWIKYDDFKRVSKSNNLWQLGTSNMCSEHNPYFDSGRMFQEAAVVWYNAGCAPQYGFSNRVRSWASPLAAPYITGIGARVTLDNYKPYAASGYSNIIRGRLAAFFYNDGVLTNKGGIDVTSEVYASVEIRPTEVRWSVVRLTDQYGIGGDVLAFGQLFLTYYFYPQPFPPNLTAMPFDLKMWFDGTKIYFSAEIERTSGEIIKAESTYTPVGKILPPKSPPFMRLETLVDAFYDLNNTPPNSADQSYIKNEWDNAWVAVEAAHWWAVEQIIHHASKGK